MNEDPHRIMADAARAEAVGQLKQPEFTVSFSPFQASNTICRRADCPNVRFVDPRRCGHA
jgi:hypothetical protein